MIDKALTLTEFGKVVGAIVQFLHHDLRDPVQHAAEAQTLQMQSRFGSTSFGKVCEVQPDPHVSQHQSHQHEEQSEYRVGGTGSDASLPQLTIAGFDSKSLAVQFANFHGRAAHTPRGVQQFLGMTTSRLVVLVALVGDDDVERHRHFLDVPCESIPSSGCLLYTSPSPRDRQKS